MARTSRRVPESQTSLYADEDEDDDFTPAPGPAANKNEAPAQEVDTEPDSNDDSDTPTPKPKRTKPKKRLSEVHGLNRSHSGNGSGELAREGTLINDDEREKRRRRKSTKLAAAPTLTDVNEGETSTQDPQRIQRTKSNAIAAVEAEVLKPINVPKDIMSSNYEEWMKLATDNKINAANSWNFALIDYFHDMSLLRNNTDNTINFQRASCTLDGCVKIWTSRVDSVGTETGKLLSNLASDTGGGGEDGDEEGEEGGEGGGKKKKNAHAPSSTLAKNPAQLRSKKLDLDFSVDPLFKKTSADFDEGGAGGLLMNHLGLCVTAPSGPAKEGDVGSGKSGGGAQERGLRVVFDAGDTVGAGEEDEEEFEDEPEDEVDLSLLRGCMPEMSVLPTLAISHSLAAFSFASTSASSSDPTFNFDPAPLYQDDNYDDDEGNEEFKPEMGADMGADAGMGGGETEDFFTGDQAVQDDYYSPDFPGPSHSHSDDGDGVDHAEGGNYGSTSTTQPFNPAHRPTERELIMAMAGAKGGGDGDGGALDYFDRNFLKGWAGPEHWRLRRGVKPKAGEEGAEKKKRGERKEKEVFRVAFPSPDAEGESSTSSLKELTKSIFAPPGPRGAGIDMPKAKLRAKPKGRGRKRKDDSDDEDEEEGKRDANMLPDDMHFTSRQLVTLFLKPRFSLRMRGQRVRFNEQGDGEVDGEFWAQAAAAAGAPDADGEGGEGDDAAVPFNTQFFHDEDDDDFGGTQMFEDIFDADGNTLAASSGDPNSLGPGGVGADGDVDLLAEGLNDGRRRRVRPEFVSYAKRAKRVDVRRLKENIWKGLGITVDHGDKSKDPDAMETDDAPPQEEKEEATDPAEARVFGSVLSRLRSSYPREKMEEISTSFCFICLLHLANEQGLKIQGVKKLEMDADEVIEEQDDIDEVKEEREKVGDLWDLKVYRDPLASAAA